MLLFWRGENAGYGLAKSIWAVLSDATATRLSRTSSRPRQTRARYSPGHAGSAGEVRSLRRGADLPSRRGAPGGRARGTRSGTTLTLDNPSRRTIRSWPAVTSTPAMVVCGTVWATRS